MAPNVRVGVGCIVSSPLHPGCFLMGTRKGSHGAGMLSFPGGHLEMNESWSECAIREIKEETNLDIGNLKHIHTTNDPAISDSAELINMEPEKCLKWDWVDWNEVVNMYQNKRELLFDPIVHFIEDGKSPITV